ncbi:helix-turn-helix transcriptional regulator [Massilia mucilaginosa]|nr:LuxR C-terminal-related transcriptional regulator [Massilia mucilaginosa]
MKYADYLLDLYRGAHDRSVREFPHYVFCRTKSVLAFDSARLIAVEVIDGSATVHCAITHQEPDTVQLDWEKISRLDTVLEEVTAHPNKAYRYNTKNLFSAKEKSVVRDYATRYHHQNGLVLAARNPRTGYWDSLSLYRAMEEDRFSAREEFLIEAFTPHLRQAILLNQACGGDHMAKGDAIAIITAAGDIQFSTPRFVELIQLDFPGWHGHRLPSLIMDGLRRVGVVSFAGKKVRVLVRCHASLLFVYAVSDSPVLSLTHRELAVARLFSRGYSHKEVAQHLHIAPATVRNFLQKIYVKLNVRDKAELATFFTQENLSK